MYGKVVPLLALAASGCVVDFGPGADGGADGLPPAICKTPGPAAQPWFTEVTGEMGLGSAAMPAVNAASVQAADLDGDNFVDLLAGYAFTARRAMPGQQHHYLLLNRPHPNDPGRRVFVDETAGSGLLATRDGAGGRGFGTASLADLDNDGDVDVVACPGSFGDPQVVDECAAFLNDGAAHFALAPASELEGAGVFSMGGSSVMLDYDRDGLLDFWPATFGGAPWLFRGAGDGTFHDVAGTMGLPTLAGPPERHESFRLTFGVTACDLDSDGDPDVLLADYGREHNQVWRNDGDRFLGIGEAIGVAADDRVDFSDDESYRCWCSLGAGRCDPGLPKPVVPCPPGPNQRFWEPGVSDQPHRLGGNTFSIACGDIDNDGDMDLVTAEIVHWDVRTSSDPSEILINDSPPGGVLTKFTRPGNDKTGLTRTRIQLWNDGDMSPVLADFDNDGRKDIYLASSDYPGCYGMLWRQKADGTFEEVSMPSGAGQKQPHGIAAVDLDNDGDLDLVLGTSTFRSVAPNNALRVYRNDAGQARNWTQVRLVGGGRGRANRSAVGARVRVTAGGVTQTQEVLGSYGHNAVENDLVLTFGLGAACAIDAIEVRWPDAIGSVETFANVRANYRVEIVQGMGGVRYLP